jgi:fatty acid-binding protein DegV
VDKIHIVTDSGCDLPAALAESLGIEVISLRRSGTEPGQITPVRYLGSFMAARTAEYTHIICVTLGSQLSQCYDNACVARGLFYEENAGAVTVEIINSRSLSIAYGDLLVEAARMRDQGAGFGEICAMLKTELPRRESIFIAYDPETILKNGDLRAEAVTAGLTIGLRPIFRSRSLKTEMIHKARPAQATGDIAGLVEEKCSPEPGHISVFAGDVPEQDVQAIVSELKKRVGGEIELVPIGETAASILGNAVLGAVFRGR